MSQNINICSIPEEVKTLLSNFRMKKVQKTAAIILKIHSESCEVVCDESIDEFELADLTELLPEREPRFVALITRHERDNGRVTYPLMLLFFSPDGCKTEFQMMYANTLNQVATAGGFSKVFKLREVEEFDEQWLVDQLSFFK